jgi:hypothetical protein
VIKNRKNSRKKIGEQKSFSKEKLGERKNFQEKI